MKKVLVALCLVSLASGRMSAELKYTMRTEVQKPEKPVSPAPNPTLVMIGESMAKQLFPDGSATMTYILGDKGVRVEFVNAALGQPAGSVSLGQPDGTAIVLNPKDQTYWKMAPQTAAAAMQAAGVKPEVTSSRTGESETVAGVPCERSTFSMKVDVPLPENVRALFKDFPASIDMAGDTCSTTDQFKKYGELAAKSQATSILAALGIDKLMTGGIVLRQAIRLGGIEVRSVVTEIAEAEVPAGSFDIPAGYKEVPPPAGLR